MIKLIFLVHVQVSNGSKLISFPTKKSQPNIEKERSANFSYQINWLDKNLLVKFGQHYGTNKNTTLNCKIKAFYGFMLLLQGKVCKLKLEERKKTPTWTAKMNRQNQND